MPGSYRPLTQILKASKLEKVKVEEEVQSESESSPIEENQDALHSKWDLE